jgi:hypothetical protein
MVEKRRARLLTVRMNDAEMAMLVELAGAAGLGLSDWVRIIVRREHTLASVARPPKRSKRTK